MELEILMKKLSSYRTEKGRLTKVSDELLGEILIAWEQWTGPAKGFYTALGADQRKMAKLIGRAKKLKREGYFPTETFREVSIVDPVVESITSLHGGIEVTWENGKVIRFTAVPQLIEFLIKYPQSQNEIEVKKAG